MPPESSAELSVRLDPEEADFGTTKSITVPAADGRPARTLTVNIPPGVRDGTLLRLPGVGTPDPPAEDTEKIREAEDAEVGDVDSVEDAENITESGDAEDAGKRGEPGDVFVRVHVRRTNRATRKVLRGVAVATGVIVAIVAWGQRPGPNSDTSGAPVGTDLPTFDYTPYVPPPVVPFSLAPVVPPPIVPPPIFSVPGLPPIDPTTPVFDTGTCLNGQLPDSQTPVTVYGVNEVSCTAPDAHYKVIQTFLGTTDLHQCDNNPKTQYAFSSGLVEIPSSGHVYCVIGLGSYAR